MPTQSQGQPLDAVLAAMTALGALLLLTTGAAVLSGVLDARAAGSRGTGLSRPFDEAARLLRQRRRRTVSADRLLWRAGTTGLLLVPVLMVAVVPLGSRAALPLDVGVLWFNAMDVLVWACVWLAGWGANSTYSLIGGYRFLAQALAYALPLMFSLIAAAAGARSLDLTTIVAAQQGVWFVVWMPVAFVTYCIAVLGFSVWGPLSTALGADLVGGALAEVSGVDRLLVLTARYGLLAAGSLFAVPMFLGGSSGPLLPGEAWTLLKAAALLALLVWARRKVPAVRPDLFMEVGWLVLLPAALVQDLVVAVIAVWRS